MTNKQLAKLLRETGNLLFDKTYDPNEKLLLDEAADRLERQNNMNMELLRAKEAIFKLIGQFHHARKFDDGELYIYNYCESALEAAFNVLGIEENYIKLTDFCQMWEDNTRAIWTINLPNEPFSGITADIHYDVFKEDYEFWERQIDEDDE